MEKLELALSEIKTAFPGLTLREHEPMSGHCSFRCGGTVRALAEPKNEEELIGLCRILKKQGLAPYMLGNCTNVVFPDEGLDICAVSSAGLCALELIDPTGIRAGAGLSMSKLAGFAQQHELAGLEFASGIPGSVGGGVLMNAGAYGGELKDRVESVRVYHLPEDKIYEISGADCEFQYRGSLFKKRGGCVILSAVFRLEKGEGEAISAKMRELNGRRRDKQPLDMPSAGSTFKRPAGGYAAAMIDEAGLKGYAVGGAQVSPKHAGFVVNTGGATFEDVRRLMEHIQNEVYRRFGVMLEPEVKIIEG